MKYKPKAFPITQAVEKRNDNFTTAITLFFEAALTIGMAQKGIPMTFLCGKPGCSGSFGITSVENRPRVCPICGSEIDWSGILTREVKRCPKCGIIGNDHDVFCKYHIPAVRLEVVEIPIGTTNTQPKLLET
jgi:hypothetical protein